MQPVRSQGRINPAHRTRKTALDPREGHSPRQSFFSRPSDCQAARASAMSTRKLTPYVPCLGSRASANESGRGCVPKHWRTADAAGLLFWCVWGVAPDYSGTGLQAVLFHTRSWPFDRFLLIVSSGSSCDPVKKGIHSPPKPLNSCGCQPVDFALQAGLSQANSLRRFELCKSLPGFRIPAFPRSSLDLCVGSVIVSQ
jgi:hypothetical protein